MSKVFCLDASCSAEQSNSLRNWNSFRIFFKLSSDFQLFGLKAEPLLKDH